MLLGEVNQGGLLKPYANELRALLAMLRLRLFETLALLPPNCLEANFAALLRLLVSGFILFYFLTFVGLMRVVHDLYSLQIYVDMRFFFVVILFIKLFVYM